MSIVGVVRDLALRALAVAAVTAVVSGGVVYFVVDQALRGVEIAVQVASEQLGARIDQTNVAIGAGDNAINGKLDVLQAGLRSAEATLGSIAAGVSGVARTLAQDSVMAQAGIADTAAQNALLTRDLGEATSAMLAALTAVRFQQQHLAGGGGAQGKLEAALAAALAAEDRLRNVCAGVRQRAHVAAGGLVDYVAFTRLEQECSDFEAQRQ